MADARGIWLPHTANHDFFEFNYVVTNFIVEFWNALTSLLIVYSGGIGLVYGSGFFFRDQPEHVHSIRSGQFWLLGLLPLIIGLGSGAFHGTMQRWGQVLDELPMVWSALIFHWALLDVAGRPAFQIFKSFGNERTLTGIFFCFGLAAGTAVYFAFDFAVFIVIYASCIAWLATRVGSLVLESEAMESQGPGGSIQRRLALQAVTTYISGFLFLWLPTEVGAAQLLVRCDNGSPRSPDSAALDFWCGLRLEQYSLLQFTHSCFHLTSAMGTIAMGQFVAWTHFARRSVPVRVHRCSLLLLGMDMVLPGPDLQRKAR